MERDTDRRPYRMKARQEAVEETRESILQAMVDLWLEKHYDDFSLADLADRAGVSRQTIFRQFGSKDDVLAAAALWLAPKVEEVSSPEPGNVEGAIQRIVDTYELIGDATARSLEIEGRIEVIDRLLEGGRTAHREWVESAFGPFLPTDEPARETLVLTLYAATDVMVWKLLRRDFGLARGTVESVLHTLVEGALGTALEKEGRQ